MPIAIVYYDHALETREDFWETLGALSNALPGVVAPALSTGEHSAGNLSPEDISVRVSKSGAFDQNVINISISVFANDYSERRVNLEDRKNAIIDGLVSVVQGKFEFSVWVLLGVGAYGFVPSSK